MRSFVCPCWRPTDGSYKWRRRTAHDWFGPVDTNNLCHKPHVIISLFALAEQEITPASKWSWETNRNRDARHKPPFSCLLQRKTWLFCDFPIYLIEFPEETVFQSSSISYRLENLALHRHAARSDPASWPFRKSRKNSDIDWVNDHHRGPWRVYHR